MPEASPQVPRPRIEGLSDLIFGLALSIGAIQLVGSVPQTEGALEIDLLAFGFSFLLLINIWNRYTALTSVMPVETTLMVRLNMALLFLVAVEPFLFNLMIVQGFGSVLGPRVSVYYALDILAMNLILAYFIHILTLEEKNLIPRELIQTYKNNRDMLVITSGVFIASMFPLYWAIAFQGVPLRIILWVTTFPMTWGARFVNRRAGSAPRADLHLG
ncbi:MAG TPA: TMEM175 family protein [Nitrososphaerales archaeon]|nr:TMEM175 family protein [Nitrososphaerales archaeon]